MNRNECFLIMAEPVTLQDSTDKVLCAWGAHCGRPADQDYFELCARQCFSDKKIKESLKLPDEDFDSVVDDRWELSIQEMRIIFTIILLERGNCKNQHPAQQSAYCPRMIRKTVRTLREKLSVAKQNRLSGGNWKKNLLANIGIYH